MGCGVRKGNAEPVAREQGVGTEVEAGAAWEARDGRGEGKRLQKGEGKREPRGQGRGVGRARRGRPRRDPRGGELGSRERGKGLALKRSFRGENPAEGSPGGREGDVRSRGDPRGRGSPYRWDAK